jgi:hypothetical protein
VQVCVLHGNCQAKASSSHSPGPRSVPTPESVEHLPGLTGFETDAMVSNRYRDCGVVTLDQNVDRMAFAVFDRVDQQITKDSFDSSGVDLGFRLAALVHIDLSVVGLRKKFVRFRDSIYDIA